MNMVVLLAAALMILGQVGSFTILGNIKLPKLPTSLNELTSAKKFEGKKLCVITGTSSGLGRQTAKKLLKTGMYHVIGAVRDMEKMNTVAEFDEFDMENFTPMQVDLASFESVHNFVKNLNEFKGGRPVDRLVCNAAVYQPTLDYAKLTKDGLEEQLQINYLSHFLLTSLLMPDMKEAKDPRVIMVGSVTGNDNTVGGGGVYPIADLRELEGLSKRAEGGSESVEMIDGFSFNGAKAYKDSKLAIMMLSNELHERYHRSTGISFSSIYPGCIAESPLFREKRPWFRKYFPLFMRYITGGFVGEEEAGQRLFQVIVDPRCSKSGVYWSWNGGPRQGRGMDALKNGGNIIGAGGAGGDWDSIYENDQSDKVRDSEMADRLWSLSTKVTNAEWPLARQPKSPCPTLKVISFVTSILDTKEKLQRAPPRSMQEAINGLLQPRTPPRPTSGLVTAMVN